MPRGAPRLAALLALLALLLFAAGREARASIILRSFTAAPQPDRSIRVEWETAAEANITAFRLYRSEDAGQIGQLIATVPARGDPVTGASYAVVDPAAGLTPGREYHYRLEALSASGGSTFYGPVSARVALYRIFLPLTLRAH